MGQAQSAGGGSRLRRRLGSVAAATLLLAAAWPALAQREVASGGYWQDAAGSGHYRASVLGSGEGSLVRVEWIANGERGLVASVTLADLGAGGPWHVSTAELRPEREETLLFLSARAARGGAERLITVALGPPGVAERR